MTKAYELVQILSKTYRIRLVCAVLGVAFGCFYAWRRGERHAMSESKAAQKAAVKTVFETHKRRYGARRIRAELKAQGQKIGRRQTSELMRSQGLKAIQPKSFVPKTTDSKHGLARSPNLLEGGKKAARPDEIYVGDITYLPLHSGRYLYLATWQDQFTKKVAGWELLRHMKAELVVNALKKAIARRKIPPGLIAHSDGGGQYASHEFKNLLAKNGFRSSMARKDNHYDNAQAESLFSRFKAELLEKGAFSSFEDAYTEIFEYFEIYYNQQRRHSSIGYETPNGFEKSWRNARSAAENEPKKTA